MLEEEKVKGGKGYGYFDGSDRPKSGVKGFKDEWIEWRTVALVWGEDEQSENHGRKTSERLFHTTFLPLTLTHQMVLFGDSIVSIVNCKEGICMTLSNVRLKKWSHSTNWNSKHVETWIVVFKFRECLCYYAYWRYKVRDKSSVKSKKRMKKAVTDQVE